MQNNHAKAFDTPGCIWQWMPTHRKHLCRIEGTDMPKEEWGTKRICPTSGKRFYDLNANPIISPYTGEKVALDTTKARTMVADAEDAQTKKAKEAEEAEELVLDDDDDDDDASVGDDVLDDDEAETVSLEEIADVPEKDDE